MGSQVPKMAVLAADLVIAGGQPVLPLNCLAQHHYGALLRQLRLGFFVFRQQLRPYGCCKELPVNQKVVSCLDTRETAVIKVQRVSRQCLHGACQSIQPPGFCRCPRFCLRPLLGRKDHQDSYRAVTQHDLHVTAGLTERWSASTESESDTRSSAPWRRNASIPGAQRSASSRTGSRPGA